MQSMQDSEDLWPLVRKHPRTQAEVARTIFSNMITGAAVTYPAMLILVWLYWGTVSTAWLISVIGFILIVQTVIVFHWHHYQQRVQAKAQSKDWAWSIQHLKQASLLSMSIIMGISMLAVVIAQAHIESAAMIASVMVLTYLVGSTIADFIYRPAVIAYPIILLTPMGVLHATSGNPTQWAIAAFFVFYFAGVLSYSSMYSKRLQLSIYQRFELDALAQRLEGERERAQQAHDAKVRFFAATSHDVRQPLQAMSILLDALRSLGNEREQRSRLLHDLDVNMDTLRALFDQVLEVSRLQAGAVQLHPRPVRLTDLFNRLQARFALQALNAGIRLDFGITNAWVKADPLALERMVANLLGNACKHTPSGGAVWIGWRNVRSRIEVRDSGSGIAPADQKRIFEEFYQIEKNTDHSQGLGLGLAIVQRLSALGGQSVGVRSELGQGSVFWLNLQSADAPVTQPAVEEPLQPTWGGLHGTQKSERGKLLFVENDATLLRLTSSLLRLNGWAVHAFADPEQALDWLSQAARCDLLLTDFRMGEFWDGVKLIEAARALPGRSSLPAIVITGDGAVAEVGRMRRLLSLPMDTVGHPSAVDQTQITRLLHKPVKTTYLLEVISQSIEQSV